MTYRIEIETPAKKGLARLAKRNKAAHVKIEQAISDLAATPRPHNAKPLTGPWAGHYRLAITAPGGEYRIVWAVDDQAKEVTISRVGPRENLY